MASPTSGYSCVTLAPRARTLNLADRLRCDNRINVNDPSLISLVNKLQDVFSTVGVSATNPPARSPFRRPSLLSPLVNSPPGPKPHRSAPNRSRRFAVEWKEFRLREHRRPGFVSCSPFPSSQHRMLGPRVANMAVCPPYLASLVVLELLLDAPSFCNSSTDPRKRTA